MPRSNAPTLRKHLFFRTKHWRRVLRAVTIANLRYVVTLYDSRSSFVFDDLVSPPTYWVSDTRKHPFAFAIAVSLKTIAAKYHWRVCAHDGDTLIFRFNSPLFYYTPRTYSHIFRTHPPARFALPSPLGQPLWLKNRRVPPHYVLGLPRLTRGFFDTLLGLLDPLDSAELWELCVNEQTRVADPSVSSVR